MVVNIPVYLLNNKKAKVSVDVNDFKDRVVILLEHLVFAVWGYYVMVVLPQRREREEGQGNIWVYICVYIHVNIYG